MVFVLFSKLLNNKIIIKFKKWWENQKGYRSFTTLPPTYETGFYCKVTTIGSTRKGNVNCYRVIPLRQDKRPEPEWNIILKLDYLPELSVAMPSRYQTDAGLIKPKDYSTRFGITHRLTILKEFSSGSMLPIFICDLNLLDEQKSKQLGANYLFRVIANSFRKIAWRCLCISDYHNKTEDMTWAGQIVRVDWANWLIEEMRFYLRDETYKIESFLIYARGWE